MSTVSSQTLRSPSINPSSPLGQTHLMRPSAHSKFQSSPDHFLVEYQVWDVPPSPTTDSRPSGACPREPRSNAKRLRPRTGWATPTEGNHPASPFSNERLAEHSRDQYRIVPDSDSEDSPRPAKRPKTQDIRSRPPASSVARPQAGKRHQCGRRPLPESWPSTPPGRSYFATTQVWDMEGKDPLPPRDMQCSSFPGKPLTKDCGRTLSPGQWRHIRSTYALCRFSLEEDEEGLPEMFRIPLGYLRQLLWNESGDSETYTTSSSVVEMMQARIDNDVLLSFPGMPLQDSCSRSLSPEQLEHVEATYSSLVTRMHKALRTKEDYRYILALLEQLILNRRGYEAREAEKEDV